MSNSPEISSLFAKMASALRNLDLMDENEDPTLALAVLNLNRSLNLSEIPRVRVLDAALSIMCFTGPQVYESMIEHYVRTIATVLSSSIGCKLFRINQQEVLRVCGSISSSDCQNLIEACAAVLEKLPGRKGELSTFLSCALVKMAVLVPRFQCALLTPISCHLPNESKINNGEVPIRLLLWYLDPMNLKQVVSQILEEVIRRPFLCLSKEIYERIEWRSTVTCLVISPSMFIETKALLQNWFLATGMAPVLDLLTQILSQVLDIISRPMWWGISMEVGSKLPFSHAYFPNLHPFLQILAGPKSLENFQDLVHQIGTSFSHSGGDLDATSTKTMKKIKMVDHKSMWALAMNFPDWFVFASVVLFSDKNSLHNSHSELVFDAAQIYSSEDVPRSCSSVAARYIGWILNPINESHRDTLVDYLTKVSGLWTLLCLGPTKCNGSTDRKENRTLNLHNKSGATSLELDTRKLSLWIQDFEDMKIKYHKAVFDLSASNKLQTCKEFSALGNLLFGRILLGILIGYSCNLSQPGCEMLLHYAATGRVPHFVEAQNSGLKLRRLKCEWQESLVTLIERYTTREAIVGAQVAFEVADLTESLSNSVDSEENGLNTICQVKSKTGNYLFMCIKRLLLLKLNEDDGLQMRNDILGRLIRWRCQGNDVFINNKDINDIVDALNCKP